MVCSEPELARIGQSTEKGDCKWEKAQRGGFLTYCLDLVVWMILLVDCGTFESDKFGVHTEILQAGCGQMKESRAVLCWLMHTETPV